MPNSLRRRIQLRARIQDWFDSRASRGWFAPAGTYDGIEGGRPFRHVVCHFCGGKHFAGNGECSVSISREAGLDAPCPCNGGCHNGWTPTCSEACRERSVRHANVFVEVTGARVVGDIESPRADGASAPLDAERLLGELTEDDVIYDYPVAQSGEPMDPVLFVRWDAISARLAALAALDAASKENPDAE